MEIRQAQAALTQYLMHGKMQKDTPGEPLALHARINANRRCEVCGKRIDYIRPRSAYCSSVCYKKVYRSSDSYKEERRRYKARWRKRYPEKRKEQRKAGKNRRRQRQKSPGHKPTTAYRLQQASPLTSQTCFYCGSDCTRDFHWDHFIPLSKGGPEAPWNLHISCPRCNLRKGDKRPESVFCEELFI